jgi:predicted RNA polymerase sigma factor
VVAVREGVDAALELVGRVGEIAQECSVLFETIGDLYVDIGEGALAHDAYMRAIDLSDDGLVVVPKIQRKLRMLK